MPHLAPQFELAILPKPGHNGHFRITGTKGHIRVQADTTPALLYGVNWYLKYVAHLEVSPDGLQVGSANFTLRLCLLPLRSPRSICGDML